MKVIEIDASKRTKTDKPYKQVLLDDDRKFNVFDFHSMYDEIEVGTEIAPESLQKDGKYWNLIDPVRGSEGGSTGRSAPPKGIPAAQERKNEYIKEAQGRKDASIAFFNATNSAIAMLPHVMFDGARDPEIRKDFIQKTVVYWRDWFLSEWEKHNDPTNKPPF